MRIFILICCWLSLSWVTPAVAKPLPVVQLQLLVSAVAVDQYEIAVLITTLELLPEVELNLRLADHPAWPEPGLSWTGALAIGGHRLVLAEQIRLAEFPASLRAELLATDRFGEQQFAQANLATGNAGPLVVRGLNERASALEAGSTGLHLIELSRP